MPEVADTTNAGAAGTGEGEGAAANGEQNTDKKDEGAEGDAAAGEGEEGEGDKKPEPKKPEGSQGDDEPPVRARKTAKDFIIERKERKIAKLQKENGSGKGDEDDEDDDSGVDPDDKKLIEEVAGKKVLEMVTPIFEERIESEDKAEVEQFVAANPEFKPYEDKVKAFMKHPSRKEVPIKAIFYEVAGDDLIKIGAARAKKAEEDALRSGTGGGSARADEGEGKPDWANMGKEEFERRKTEMLYPKS